MTRRKVRFSRRFQRKLDDILASGALFLLRAQAVEDAFLELRENPMNNDGRVKGLEEPHWVKVCRASGRVDTGLRVIFLPHEDGSIYADDLFVSPLEES